MPTNDIAPMTAQALAANLRTRCQWQRELKLDVMAIGVTNENRPLYHEVIGGVQGVVFRHYDEGGAPVTIVSVQVEDIERALEVFAAKEVTRVPG
jgi:hypothetical protein